MRKTTAANAASGSPSSSPVSAATTTNTVAAAASWASWLRPPASSTICVFVGLPLTTNEPVRAAPTFAPASPTRSLSVSTCSSYRAA